MSRKQSSNKNIDFDDSPYVYSVFSSTPSHKNDPIQEPQQSSSPQQLISSSHDQYVTNKKQSKKKIKSNKLKNKLKKKNNNKSKSKNKSKQKIQPIKSNKILTKNIQEQENFKNEDKNQKKRKAQLTLNKFLGKKSQDQEIKEQKKVQNIAFFNLYPYQADYLNSFQFFKGYSLQNINQKPQMSKIANKQKTLNQYLKRQKKRLLEQSSESQEIQVDRTYFRSYFVIKNILKQMLESQKVPQFFKYPIDEDIQTESQLRYYQKYKQIIEEPLDLQSLDERVDQKNIKNLMEFEGAFNEMIRNSYVFHKYLNDEKMLKSTFQLQKLYHKIMTELSCPQMNEYSKSSIKTTSFMQRPRSKKVSVEGENREIDYMDLNDLINKHRIKVMNHFLRIVCQKTPQNLYTFINRIRNLIHRYPDDKVEIINQSSRKNKSIKKFSLYESKQLSSSKSIQSQNQQNDEIYQISIQSISVNLFQQLKELIKSQVKELKRQQNLGEKSQEIIRHILYPHEDSEDFDSDDT